MKTRALKIFFLLAFGPLFILSCIPTKESMLYAAAYHGDLTLVKKMLDKGADINAGNKAGYTALHVAAKNGNLDLINMLLDRRAKVDVTNKKGETPLFITCIANQPGAMIQLLKRGASPNIADNDHHYPLPLAIDGVCCKQFDVDVVQKLLEAKADPNVLFTYDKIVSSPDRHTTETVTVQADPLHYAIANGQTKIIELLLEHGANVESIPPALKYEKSAPPTSLTENATPLAFAVEFNQLEIAKILHQHGANPFVVQSNGSTPLHKAALFGYTDTVKWLISVGVNVNSQTKTGHTPLYMAAAAGHVDIVNELLAHGANPNLTAMNGGKPMTPLQIAEKNGRQEIVNILKVH